MVFFFQLRVKMNCRTACLCVTLRFKLELLEYFLQDNSCIAKPKKSDSLPDTNMCILPRRKV